MRALLLAGLVAVGWAGTASAAVVLDPSFESPALPNNGYGNGNNYQYTPGGTPWTYSGNSGVSANGGPFYSGSAPDGVQAAFLQSGSNFGSSISQTVTGLMVGTTYVLTFYQASRAGYGVDPIDVVLGSIDFGNFTNSSTSFIKQTSQLYIATSTTALLTFAATNFVGSDNDVNIDQVALTQVPEPATLALLGLGAAGILVGRRRRAT